MTPTTVDGKVFRKEKRKETRILASETFFIEFKKGLIFKKVGAGNGRDLSVSGLRFVTFMKFRKADKFDLTLCFSPRFPGEKRLSLRARVLRAYRPKGAKRLRVACRLLHRSEDTKNTIREFISWVETNLVSHLLRTPKS